MFSSLSVARVCLFVCLLATLRQNGWTDFHEIFRIGGYWYKEQLWTFSGHLTPWTQDFFPTFSEESMTLSSIAEKRSNGFSWNFQKRTDLTQGAIWSILGILRLTAWVLGRYIYFMDPCLFVTLWKNGWTDFHDFFTKCQARHKK